jgi:hypothetical protein
MIQQNYLEKTKILAHFKYIKIENTGRDIII